MMVRAEIDFPRINGLIEGFPQEKLSTLSSF